MTDRDEHPDRPAARLRAAGLRATLPRVTVLRWLDGDDGHHSADDVATATGLARTTAFGVLAQLREHGLVTAVEHDRGTLYETGPAHFHATCDRCGLVVDVPPDDADVTTPSAIAGMATVHRADLLFRGTCERCAAEA